MGNRAGMVGLLALLLALRLPAAGEQDEMLRDLWRGSDEACAAFELSGAHEFAERAVQLDPEGLGSLWRLVRSQVDRGEAAQDEGRDGEAEEWFGRALGSSQRLVELYPESSRARYYRALALGRRALFAGGREKVELSREIERQARQAIELDSTNARALGLLGRYYREMAQLGWVQRTLAETLFGELPEGGEVLSRELLETSVELAPDWLFAWYELGLTRQALGLEDESRECFRRVLELPALDHRDAQLKGAAREALAGR
jgi:tetratricopeptide (TPR) repeat protein